MIFRRAVRPLGNGAFALRLSGDEREVLRDLPDQLRELLEGSPDEPALRRLAPPAYAESDDAEYEDEYRRYMGDDLLKHQVDALAVMRETAGADRLTGEQAAGWLSALNSLRLVIGTQLDVSEELDASEVGPDDPRYSGLQMYGYLTWLLDQFVDALADGLPDVVDEDG